MRAPGAPAAPFSPVRRSAALQDGHHCWNVCEGNTSRTCLQPDVRMSLQTSRKSTVRFLPPCCGGVLGPCGPTQRASCDADACCLVMFRPRPPQDSSRRRSGAHLLYAAWLAANRGAEFFNEATVGAGGTWAKKEV